MLWTSTVTLASRSAFCMTATTSTASTTPGIVPRAAEDVDPAQEHDGDDGQGHPLPGVGPGARQARGEDHAGQGGDDPAEHEQAGAQPLDAHARVARGPGALADGIDLAPDPRPVEHDAEDECEREEDHERPGDRGSPARSRSPAW